MADILTIFFDFSEVLLPEFKIEMIFETVKWFYIAVDVRTVTRDSSIIFEYKKTTADYITRQRTDNNSQM